MKERQLGSATGHMVFLMVLSADKSTGATGLTPTVTISKNAGAFGAPAGAVTELANGWYKLAANATDRDTLGDLVIHATAATADPVDDRYAIIAYDPFNAASGGLSNLDATVSSRSTFAGGAVASVTADVGITQAGADKVWGSAARTLTSFGTLVADAATAVWGAATRILTAGTNIVLAKGVGVTGFNDIAATDIVTGGAIATGSGKVNEVVLVDTLTTYTGNTPQTGDSFARIGVNGAGLTAIPGASAPTVQQIRAEMDTNSTKLALLDAAISSRLATSGYTAADNATVALIAKILRNKTVTDPATGVMTVYDDDSTTPLFTCNVFEDAAGTQAYRDLGADRRNRLT